MRKGYVAIQRPGGYNVLVVDLWWNRVPRLAAKIPAEPTALGLTSPFPHLPEVWTSAEREWGWTLTPGTPLPDVGVLVDLIRPFQPARGPMTAPAAPIPAASGRQPDASTFQAARAYGETLEAAIQRLASSARSRNFREAAYSLLAIGYELQLPKNTAVGERPENYLRIINPRYPSGDVGRLTTASFSFTDPSHQDRLGSLPGAIQTFSPEDLSHWVDFSHIESAQPGLAAARLVK